jgi:hypothetical protein
VRKKIARQDTRNSSIQCEHPSGGQEQAVAISIASLRSQIRHCNLSVGSFTFGTMIVPSLINPAWPSRA